MVTDTHLEECYQLLEMLQSYRRSQVLLACVNLGVFDALSTGARSVEDLAALLAVDGEALERLLNTATVLGLLERHGDTYRNAAAPARCLASPDSDVYLGNFLRREQAFYERWGRLTQAVRTGRRPDPNLAMEDTDNWVRDFTYSLYDLARLYGPVVAETLDLDQSRPWRVLDVGGGHGGYSIPLARRYPHLEATVFDLPAVIEVSQEIVAGTDVADRVHVSAGDFLEDDLGDDYDLALIFGVLISEPVDRRRALLRRVHGALRADGTLVLREFVLDGNGLGSAEVLLFDLAMLLSTEAGGALEYSTLTADLEATGFRLAEIRPLPMPGSNDLWIASRSAVDQLGSA